MKTIINFKSIESFSTERLTAIKITADDLDKFITMHNDHNVMETLGGLRTIDQTQENLDWNLMQWKQNGFGLWMFYLKHTNEWVGRSGLRRVEVGGHEEIELGYALMPEFWNKGFATEMAKACIEIAFEVLRLNNIVCFTLKTNKASQSVMKKVGFQYERDIIHADLPHVLYRMKDPRKVEVVSYDPEWPKFYKQESQLLQKVLGNHLKEIYQIGSTAIPNMPAKPVIDIMLVCENLDAIDDIIQKLNTLGYYNIRRQIIPHRSFFVRRKDEKMSFHLHIHERGSPQLKRHVNFRDYMIAHPLDAKRYAELKMKLAEQFCDDMNSYVFGKDKLVQEIDTKAKLWTQRKKDYLPSNTGPSAKDWSKKKLIKAMVANLNVQMTHFAQYLNQVELIRIPGFTIVNSGMHDDTFNYVLDADFSNAEANKKINEVTNYFRDKNIPFSWWISPYDKPDDLSKHLENSGYINTTNSVAMYFDLDKWDSRVAMPSNLQIIQATDEKTLRDFAFVLTKDEASCTEYFAWIASVLTDDDPIEYFVGYVNDRPVVCGSSCYFAQLTGLNDLSTTSDERNKGYAKAMQYYRLKRAKELGYHIAVLQASHEGYPLYTKLGYKECGTFREFKLR
jgi:GrpB-like predicted nucleotidyltransferase (UPF0157 family)/RimJ/RimL family protein N-acetyltransferase